jgi:hypothetical protein
MPAPPRDPNHPAADQDERAADRFEDDDEQARERGISDFVRRAVAAGLEVAGRGKDDVVRVAANEIRNWLDHLELDTELRKALSRMVLEVKAEIRFREADDGKLHPEVTDASVKPSGRPGGTP